MKPITQKYLDDYLGALQAKTAKSSSTLIRSFYAIDSFKGNAKERWVDLTVKMKPDFANVIDSVHGGYLAGFIDHWTGGLGHCFYGEEGLTTTTEDLQVNYLNPIRIGDTVVFHCEICHVGSRSIIIHVSGTANNKKVVLGTANIAVIKK